MTATPHAPELQIALAALAAALRKVDTLLPGEIQEADRAGDHAHAGRLEALQFDGVLTCSDRVERILSAPPRSVQAAA